MRDRAEQYRDRLYRLPRPGPHEVHRDHPGYNTATRYRNTTGRNDFVALKVTRDESFLYFYARTRVPSGRLNYRYADSE